MRMIVYLPLLLVGLLLAGPVPAQEPVTLEQCIELAMQNQADVLMAHNNIVAAQSRATRAKASYWPQLSVQNNAFSFGSESVLNKTTTGTAFAVSQNVFDGGIREAGVRQARYGVTESSARLSRTTQTVAFDVTRSFYDVLRARRLAEVADSSVKYTEELREQIKARAELGEAAQVDVLPIDAQLANARVTQLTAKNQVRTAALALQNAIGLMPTPSFDVAEVKTAPDLQIASLDAYMADARASRPDVLETKASSGAARAAVRAARISLYPRPVITGQYQRQISGGFTTSGAQMVGGIVFDIFNGGANKAALKEAQALQANAQEQEKQVFKDIQAQVESAYLNLTSAKERLAASEISLAAAKKNYEVQKEKYALGLAITLDLLNAEMQVVTSETNEVQARYDYYTAISQLEYVVGSKSAENAGNTSS